MLNVRSLAAVFYLVLFLVTMLNFAILPSMASSEMAPVTSDNRAEDNKTRVHLQNF
jgi:hypothetical protein